MSKIPTRVQPKRNCARARNSFAAIINPKGKSPLNSFLHFTHFSKKNEMKKKKKNSKSW